MSSFQPEPEQTNEQTKAPYRPPAGVPVEHPGRWGLPVSILLHVLIIFLLIVPAVATGVIPSPLAIGAGGPGPTGGGGGGSAGAGVKSIVPERLRFLHVMPQAAPAPPAQPAVTPPVPPPVEKEPEPTPPPEPVKTSAAESAPVEVSTSGEGAGTGNDGTSGTGPGTGGGIGSGVGTGIGSGVGPGTGGGVGDIYPPSPTQLLLPPQPVPKELAGTSVEIFFDVDSTGKVLSIEFAPTRNRSFNSKLRERLQETRFRPATRPDGTPVRARAPMTITL